MITPKEYLEPGIFSDCTLLVFIWKSGPSMIPAQLLPIGRAPTKNRTLPVVALCTGEDSAR